MKLVSSVLLVIIVSMLWMTVAGQDKDKVDPEHTNYYKEPPVIIETEYGAKIINPVARMDFSKFGVQIENKMSDYLFVKCEEAIFKYDHAEYSPKKEKTFVIKPYDKKTATYKVDGDARFHVDEFSFELNGLYRVAVDGNIHNAPDFQLPASVNEFKAGPFTVSCKKVKQETQETEVQFECEYNGVQIGLVNPVNLAVKIDSGQEWANDNKKSKTHLMNPGDKVKFTAIFHVPGKIKDMQFATMHVVWKNTFIESTPEKIKSSTFKLELDPGLTQGKNK